MLINRQYGPDFISTAELAFGLQIVKYYFRCTSMKGKRKPYTVYQLASAIFMILALLWLTISIPFVYASQQQLAKEGKMVNSTSPFAGSEEETTKTPSNTTEGKTSNSNSFSEEYLHDLHIEEYYISIASHYHKGENASVYIAYHGELLVPPPNVA